jgi:hypothetical protein
LGLYIHTSNMMEEFPCPEKQILTFLANYLTNIFPSPRYIYIADPITNYILYLRVCEFNMPPSFISQSRSLKKWFWKNICTPSISFHGKCSCTISILLRDIQLTHVQRSEVQLWKRCFLTKMFTLNEANTLVALPNAWRRSVCALS